ncbi:uncharacterized protein LOC108633031 [Ceratina calcarata]|uniref:Uncharacterized protein LOC108633031 n=1 Tax=Ceratina calcarata TaxID=156304 RepID=A0AAJ7JH49_9HYME|nr:uncharacterized protein LOC108633031 [Ceratina calcarata]
MSAEMALETPSWLNIDFAERILRLSEDDSTIQVIDVFTKRATNKGDNYTSDMMRVTIEFSRKQGDKRVNDKKALIFKFEPMEEGPRQDLIRKIQIFDTEIAMLSDTLKKMNDMLGCRLGAHIYHVRMERPLCLIMEDLATLGFRMANRQLGLDLTHTMMTIRALAKFHASSVALCEKEPKQKAIYWKGMFSSEYPEDIVNFMVTSSKGIAAEVDKWPELGKRYGDKIRSIVPKLYEKSLEVMKRNDDEFNVINHGDCWVNNMMFRYDENSKPIEHIFVDFQLCVYNSPAIDLHYFLATSPSEEVYTNHLEEVKEEYLRTLTLTMQKLNCKTSPPTMDELKRTLKERAFYALVASFTVLPLVVANKEDVIEVDELVNKDASLTYLTGEQLRKILTRRIPEFDELGLLDP